MYIEKIAQKKNLHILFFIASVQSMKKTVREKLLELQLVSIYLKFSSDLLLKNLIHQ
jgi:hypothetical protein